MCQLLHPSSSFAGFPLLQMLMGFGDRCHIVISEGIGNVTAKVFEVFAKSEVPLTMGCFGLMTVVV